MNFEEHAGKSRVLVPAGIGVPRGLLCTTPAEVAEAARRLGPCVVKAQVAAGKRGKAGGIKRADTPDEARRAAEAILGMRIGGAAVARVLVEERAEILREFYAAVLPDARARQPLLLFSTEGGMDIEELSESKPDAIRRLLVDIDRPLDPHDVAAWLAPLHLGGAAPQVVDAQTRL